MRNARLYWLLILWLLSGCTKEALQRLRQFTPPPKVPMARATVDFCNLAARKTKSKLKIVFIVDKSGSNQSLDGTPGDGSGTDMNGDLRYGPIESFLGYKNNDTGVFYSLINFSSSDKVYVASADTNSNDPEVKIGFLQNDAKQFKTIVDKEWMPEGQDSLPKDDGWTDYIKALQQADALITQDIALAHAAPEKISSYYVVFFISDGAPIINWKPDPFPTGTFIREDDAAGKSTIQDLIVNHILAHQTSASDSDVVESVQMHTGYYYNAASFDHDAQALLTSMATWGKGQEHDFGNGHAIDYSQFSVPELHVRHTLKDVFVEDENTVWWNGTIMKDTDGDGIPDDIESKLGSSPLLKDSDGNGVGDGVELYATGAPCKDSKCESTLAEPYKECDRFLDPAAPSGVRQYIDSDSDFLNDCEESIALKSRSDEWDTNLDWIPDPLAFRAGISFTAGTNDIGADPDSDSFDNYWEVKFFTPPLFNNSRIESVHPYQYDLASIEGDDPTQSCYELNVSNITQLGDHDTIRVYIMENNAAVTEQRFLRTFERSLDNAQVTFTNDDFAKAMLNAPQ